MVWQWESLHLMSHGYRCGNPAELSSTWACIWLGRIEGSRFYDSKIHTCGVMFSQLGSVLGSGLEGALLLWFIKYRKDSHQWWQKVHTCDSGLEQSSPIRAIHTLDVVLQTGCGVVCNGIVASRSTYDAKIFIGCGFFGLGEQGSTAHLSVLGISVPVPDYS